MALFPVQTQNGNTSSTSTYSGGGITNHEAWACQLNSTGNNNTGAYISGITVFINPTRYNVTTTVEGPAAISFQLNSNGV
jgi:hypothetical protein